MQLIDIKSLARKPAWHEVDADALHLHALAVERLPVLRGTGLSVTLACLAVTRTKSPEVVEIPVEVSSRAAGRVLEKLRHCERGMRLGVVYPAPGLVCAGCGHARACQQWPVAAAVREDVAA